MPPLRLTLAINESDQVRDLVLGRVPVQGVELTCLSLPVEEIFFRFPRYGEWEVSELSLAKFTHLHSRSDEAPVAIPVFPSRMFRHSAIFVRGDGSIRQPADLKGRRVGVPEWTQTATVYVRGLLAHTYGVGLDEIDWVQAGTNEPGRVEGVELDLPPGVRLTRVPDRSLNDLLLAGEIDAIVAAHPPAGLDRESGRIVRLFEDYQQVEEAYYRETGVFPIMHVVAIRRDVHEASPWVAMELLKAFEEAKRRSLMRMLDPNAPFTPVPWGPARAQRMQELFGEDFWPYGIEPNRPTLAAFLRFAYEQGVSSRLLEPEDLFVDEVKAAFRI
jgi:4,5-dihydroxyphthalate decarboxylase